MKTYDDFMLVHNNFPNKILLGPGNKYKAVDLLHEDDPAFLEEVRRSGEDFEQQRKAKSLFSGDAFREMKHPFPQLTYQAFRKLRPHIESGELSGHDIFA